MVIVLDDGRRLVLGPAATIHIPQPKTLDLSMSSGPPAGGPSVSDIVEACIEEYDETQG
jgi:hypothetical protein